MTTKRYIHSRVKDAEYRIRKHRNKLLYMVIEYYQGHRVMLVDNQLSLKAAHTLSNKLATRSSF